MVSPKPSGYLLKKKPGLQTLGTCGEGEGKRGDEMRLKMGNGR